MTNRPSDIMFSDSVKAVQEQLGSRRGYESMAERGGFQSELNAEVTAFIAQRDSFYLATASADGRPYIQHRGGPKGFLRVLDERTLGFADFRGNKQYISVGNLNENDRAFVFLMDYANRQRIKLWGRAEIVEDDPELVERLRIDGYDGKPERAFLFHVEAWDVNCPQHIVPRFSHEDIEPLRERIRALEAENLELRERLGKDPDASH